MSNYFGNTEAPEPNYRDKLKESTVADITMCGGVNCDARRFCYRYTAIPTPGWQAYFSPQLPAVKLHEITRDDKLIRVVTGCAQFWRNDFKEKDAPKIAVEKQKNKSKLTTRTLRVDVDVYA